MGAVGNGWIHPLQGRGLDGSQRLPQAYPKDALPKAKVGYFSSVIAVDGEKYQVIPNPLNRYLLNTESPLKFNADRSLTIAFAAKPPEGIPQENWLPPPSVQNYNLTCRKNGGSL